MATNFENQEHTTRYTKLKHTHNYRLVNFRGFQFISEMICRPPSQYGGPGNNYEYIIGDQHERATVE